MKLSINGMKDHKSWEKAGIVLPGYDVERVSAKAKEAPVWVHFGIGNIFRVFIGGIAEDLKKLGVEDMQPVITGKKTYIAPFVNAEKPQYLVIEDRFFEWPSGSGKRLWRMDVSRVVPSRVL